MENISIILTSSVIAAFVSSIVNWTLFNKKFKNDYYKLIVEQRLSAYKELKHLTTNLKSFKKNPYFCISSDNYVKFLFHINQTFDQQLFLSDEMNLIFEKLKDTINLLNQNVHDELTIRGVNKEKNDNYNEILDNTIKIQSEKLNSEIQSIKLEMLEQLKFDLKNLHEIKNFFEEN